MNVEDNLDSDIFYDFWQLSGCAVVLCHNVRHISKITTYKNGSRKHIKSCDVYVKSENGNLRAYYVINGNVNGAYIDL